MKIARFLKGRKRVSERNCRKIMSHIEGSNTECSDKNELKKFLKTHGLSAYTRNFISQGYELELLQKVEQDDLNDLCKELNLPLKHKLKLKKAVKQLKLKHNTPTNTPIYFTERLIIAFAVMFATFIYQICTFKPQKPGSWPL